MHGERYGDFVGWDQKAAERRSIIGFPYANMILSSQELMMGFLRNVVEQLLEGIDSSQPGSIEKWNQVAIHGFKHTNSAEFPSPYMNQPFSPPPILDIDKLISIVNAKVAELDDHIWLLQTDPDYFVANSQGNRARI